MQRFDLRRQHHILRWKLRRANRQLRGRGDGSAVFAQKFHGVRSRNVRHCHRHQPEPAAIRLPEHRHRAAIQSRAAGRDLGTKREPFGPKKLPRVSRCISAPRPPKPSSRKSALPLASRPRALCAHSFDRCDRRFLTILPHIPAHPQFFIAPQFYRVPARLMQRARAFMPSKSTKR